MADYYIRFAKSNEKESIIDFYNSEWRKGQLLNDEKFFSYYYVNGGELNFVIAIKEEKIVGACGFVRASGRDVWGSNLFVKKGEEPTLVFKLIKYFEDEGLNFCGVGIVENTKRIYKILGYEVGELKHYYKLFNRNEYKIATVFEKEIYTNNIGKYQVRWIGSEKMLKEIVDCSIFDHQRPLKSYEYLVKRYFCFPYTQYEYKVWAIEVTKKCFPTLFVTREQRVGMAKIMRIVDIIGSELELLGIGWFFEEQGERNGYEYVDCWCYGIDNSIFRELGFVCNNANIIPDRLEPLQKCNEKIFFFYHNMAGFRAFRADGDVDRPNILYNAILRG